MNPQSGLQFRPLENSLSISFHRFFEIFQPLSNEKLSSLQEKIAWHSDIKRSSSILYRVYKVQPFFL